jgi:hypothetical protein
MCILMQEMVISITFYLLCIALLQYCILNSAACLTVLFVVQLAFLHTIKHKYNCFSLLRALRHTLYVKL